MVFFYLTNVALDVSMGAAWWITKTAVIGIYNGTRYIIYGSEDQKDNSIKEEDELNIQILKELKDLKEEINILKNDKDNNVN